MDFSSLNPTTTNALSLAARGNDVETVKRLLKKMNPACIDNRGWTSLHEAAASDSYDSMMLILQHPDCRPLAETHEGHTALYLACRHKCSMRTLKALLDNVEDIANYGSTESVTPLHTVSGQGRLEAIQLLLDYGAIINVQDFDGDTPLHDAANEMKTDAISILLHAGADPEIKNSAEFTPIHLASYKGSLENVKILLEFMNDVNQLTSKGLSPLMLATQGYQMAIVEYLLANGADPHIKNEDDNSALDIALRMGYCKAFELLLKVTDRDKINKTIMLQACKPHLFQVDILDQLLSSDMGPEFFNFYEKFHIIPEKIGGRRIDYFTNSPLNSYLNVCDYIFKHCYNKFKDYLYLFLLRGVSVNAVDGQDCPPLVYLHHCPHNACFETIFQIFIDHGLNVDYCSSKNCINKDKCLPDAFMSSLSSDPRSAIVMFPYSLNCEPSYFLYFASKHGLLNRIAPSVQSYIVLMINPKLKDIQPETFVNYVPPLKHLCRMKIRSILKWNITVQSANHFIEILNKLPLPSIIIQYLRYL